MQAEPAPRPSTTFPHTHTPQLTQFSVGDMFFLFVPSFYCGFRFYEFIKVVADFKRSCHVTRINKVIKAREAKDCGRDSNSAVAAAVAKTRRAGEREIGAEGEMGNNAWHLLCIRAT